MHLGQVMLDLLCSLEIAACGRFVSRRRLNGRSALAAIRETLDAGTTAVARSGAMARIIEVHSAHDRFMPPHFIWADFKDVVADLTSSKLPVDLEWFRPHFEFRFQRTGTLTVGDIELELR